MNKMAGLAATEALMKLSNGKPRSTFSTMPEDIRNRLDEWLFEENLLYREVVARLESEFRIRTSVAAVHRYYRKQVTKRTWESSGQADATAREIGKLLKNDGMSGAVNLLSHFVCELASGKKSGAKNLMSMVKLMLKAHEIELKKMKARG